MPTSVLDPPATRRSVSPAQQLRTTMAAVRVSFTWLGIRKTLSAEQKAQAAESFGAAGEFLSAGKKLIDNRHAAFRAVTAIRGKVQTYWKSLTLPYPEPGIRLIKQDQIDAFDVTLRDLRGELVEAVEELDAHYNDFKVAARQRLGTLYNPSDYPAALEGLFLVDWDFPNVEPPGYLRELNPELYEQERARVIARFEEAVQLAESAFLDEFGKLVSHLCERIQGVDGEKKIFRDSAVTNLREFFDRFKGLNVRSNEQLDALVAQAQQVVRGIEPRDLRERPQIRQQVATDLSRVQSALDQLLVDRPRRRILRGPVAAEGN